MTRGSIRIELGGGALAGGTLEVHTDGAGVRIALDTPAGADAVAWKAKLADRLGQRGVDVEELVVT